MRFVLDTNVIVAGLRSPTGASAALIDRALSGSFVLVLSVALALEYEAVCREPEQRIASGLSEPEVETIVTALCAVAEPVETRFLWRPQLHDPADEMVLEAAINGAADVSFNSLAALPAGVFDELTALEQLLLNNDSLTALPAGIFDELTALTLLLLNNNSLTALPRRRVRAADLAEPSDPVGQSGGALQADGGGAAR